MCLLQQTCGIKNKIIRAGLPEPFLKHKEQCPLKVTIAYCGQSKMTVGSQGRNQNFTAQFITRINTPVKELSNSVNSISQTRTEVS